MQEVHDVLHDMLVVDDSLLHADELLQKHRVVHAELVVALLKLLQLLLCCDELCVEKIHLLRRHHVIHDGVGLAWCWRFSADVVQGIFVVGFEVGVLEFPGLSTC